MTRMLEGWRSQLSKTPNGKWRGDLFDGEADMPEAFFVMSGSRDAALARMHEKWPYAEPYVVTPCDMCDGSGLDDDGDVCSTCDGEAEIAVPHLSTL